MSSDTYEKSGLIIMLFGVIAGTMMQTSIAPFVNIMSFILVAGGSVLFSAHKSKEPFSIPIFSVVIALYFLYLLANLFLARVAFFALTSFPYYAALPFICFMVLQNIEGLKRQKLFFATSLIIAFIPYALWGLYQFFFMPEMYAHHASHPFTNANTLGCFAAVMIILSLGLFYHHHSAKNRKAYIFAFTFVLYAALLIATGSRGALLSVLSSLFAFFILSAPSKKLSLIPSLFLGVISYSLFLILNKVAAGQVSSLYHSALHGRSYNERQVIWEQALEMIKDAPLWGYGIGNYSVILPAYRSAGDGSSGLNAHSNYLHMGTEIGCVGLALFFVILIYAGYLVLRHLWFSIQYARASSQKGGNNNNAALVTNAYIAATLSMLLQGIVTALMLNTSYGFLLGICAAFVIATLQSQRITLPPITRHAIMLVMVFAALTPFITPTLSNRYVQGANAYILSNDIPSFDSNLMLAAALSFHTNPFVYNASAELPFSLLRAQGSLLSANQREELRNRAHKLYNKSLELNPYMAMSYYKEAMLFIQQDRLTDYEIHLQKALEVDGGFLPARLELAAFYKRQNRNDDYVRIMRGGENWFYWRFTPLSYYSKLKDIYENSALSEEEKGSLIKKVNDNIDNAQTRRKRGIEIQKMQ